MFSTEAESHDKFKHCFTLKPCDRIIAVSEPMAITNLNLVLSGGENITE